MEYCGAGSISQICKQMGSSLTENQIALICRETLKVGKKNQYPFFIT